MIIVILADIVEMKNALNVKSIFIVEDVYDIISTA